MTASRPKDSPRLHVMQHRVIYCCMHTDVIYRPSAGH